MSPSQIEALVARLAPALEGLSDWAVIGSAALVILGLPIEDCPDLDVLTSEAGAAELEAAWAAWRSEDYAPDLSAPFRSRFSRYAAPEGAIEVMGGLRLLGPEGWAPVTAGEVVTRRFGGASVRIPAAAEQLRILRLFGRPKDLAKARVLEAWLASA
jgi:hypothetical protein